LLLLNDVNPNLALLVAISFGAIILLSSATKKLAFVAVPLNVAVTVPNVTLSVVRRF
jgi:hypothetical protein